MAISSQQSAISHQLSAFSILLVSVFIVFLFSCSDTSTPTSPAVDNIDPAVEWVHPQAGGELSGVVELRFKVSDEGGIDSARVYLDGYSPDGWQITDITSELQVIYWNTLESDDGVHILEARAWDKAGNLGLSPSLRVIVRNGVPPSEDRTPPDLWWLAPEAGATLADTVTIQIGFFDESGVDSVALYLNGSQRAVIPAPAGIQTGQVEYFWDTLQDSDGLHLWEARAWDTAGNTGVSAGLLVRVQNHETPTEDHTPPDVWWEAPEPGSTLMDTVIIRLRVFDESGVDSVRLYRNGAIVSAGVPAGSEYVYEWNTTSDSDGVHLWEARAWDAAGNSGVSAGLLVRVQNHETPPEDHTPPVITWLSPEPGDTVQGTVDLHFQLMDDVGLDSAKVFVNGAVLQNFNLYSNFFDSFVTWITSDHNDGIYIVEVRAWDTSGNVGFGVGVVLMVWNNRPRVIWVPDDFETIQGAINASSDGDTVRVRAGTYYEGLRISGKRLWLESEDGPVSTFIDGAGWSAPIMAIGDLTSLVVRGFTVLGDFNGIESEVGSITTIYNCIVTANVEYGNGIVMYDGDAYVYNCVVDGAGWGILVGYVSGEVYNSMFLKCDIGYRQTALAKNWVAFGWNLFWENVRDYRVAYRNDEPQEGDIFENPRFVEGGYRLQGNSPAIDSGNPDLLDRDGSRSDIGIYGGLYAY